MKKILIDLKAIGRPIDSIQPILNMDGRRNIFTDDAAGLARDVQQLVHDQFGYQLGTLFHCQDRVEWHHWTLKFGCNMDVHEFRTEAGKFVLDFVPADAYLIAPDESDATDACFTCRAADQGFCLSQSDGCLLAKTVPETMLDDIMSGDCAEYAILVID